MAHIASVVSLAMIIVLVRKYAQVEQRIEEAMLLPADSIFALTNSVTDTIA